VVMPRLLALSVGPRRRQWPSRGNGRVDSGWTRRRLGGAASAARRRSLTASGGFFAAILAGVLARLAPPGVLHATAAGTFLTSDQLLLALWLEKLATHRWRWVFGLKPPKRRFDFLCRLRLVAHALSDWPVPRSRTRTSGALAYLSP